MQLSTLSSEKEELERALKDKERGLAEERQVRGVCGVAVQEQEQEQEQDGDGQGWWG
jgi:hypothetical protein